MADPIQTGDDTLRVSVLSEALPYIQRLLPHVIKYGGAAMAHAELRKRCSAILPCWPVRRPAGDRSWWRSGNQPVAGTA